MALRSLRTEFKTAIGGGEAAIRINTDEQEDALRTIYEACERHGWEMRVWDHATGISWWNGKTPEHRKQKTQTPNANDPAAALQALAPKPPSTFLSELVAFLNEPPVTDAQGRDTKPVVTVFRNFHLAFERDRGQAVSVVQHLVSDKVQDYPEYDKIKDQLARHGVTGDHNTGKFLVGLVPEEAQFPPEVRPLFKVITHELPDETELGHILDGVATGEGDERPSAEDKKKICQFALGLTRLQAEGVFGACLVEHSKVLPDYVWREKSAILNKEGLVDLYQGKEKFADVAGLAGAKEFMTKLLTPTEWDEDPDVRAKGALFVGHPGVGKSLIAKATGNELGLPTLFVHPGNWMGSLVGESEAKTRKGFQTVRAHAPCIAVIDEVEKVMPSSKGGDHDGGVGARMEGTFLTALNDIKESVFWVFTANDTQRMHEAFFRAERVDAVFYVGLPTPESRAQIWKLYLKKFFPAQIEGRAYPGHIDLNVDRLLAEAKKIGKKLITVVWANKLVAALMCLAPGPRKAALAKIRESGLFGDADVTPVQDDGWTPAEIRACCRLSRRLDEPLTQTQRRVRPVSVTAAATIRRLEKWASAAALDAESGEVYQTTEETEQLIESLSPRKRQAAVGDRKVRRTVRTLGRDSDEE